MRLELIRESYHKSIVKTGISQYKRERSVQAVTDSYWKFLETCKLPPEWIEAMQAITNSTLADHKLWFTTSKIADQKIVK